MAPTCPPACTHARTPHFFLSAFVGQVLPCPSAARTHARCTPFCQRCFFVTGSHARGAGSGVCTGSCHVGLPAWGACGASSWRVLAAAQLHPSTIFPGHSCQPLPGPWLCCKSAVHEAQHGMRAGAGGASKRLEPSAKKWAMNRRRLAPSVPPTACLQARMADPELAANNSEFQKIARAASEMEEAVQVRSFFLCLFFPLVLLAHLLTERRRRWEAAGAGALLLRIYTPARRGSFRSVCHIEPLARPLRGSRQKQCGYCCTVVAPLPSQARGAGWIPVDAWWQEAVWRQWVAAGS